jgi:transcriptional regulator with XRE-family HTH domain
MELQDELRQQVSMEIKRRRATGETFVQIAKSVGVSSSSVWHWERGKKFGMKALTLLARQAQVPNDHQTA